jgi:predicted metal-binding protein
MFPYQKADLASESFQTLEDLSTGSWYSEALFAALELGVFDALLENPHSCEELAKRLKCDCDGLGRFMNALAAIGLVIGAEGKYENGPLASRFLVRSGADFAGDFIHYRRFLASSWKRLSSRIRDGVHANDRPADESSEAYALRVFDYVRAMDFQARMKAAEAADHLMRMADIKPHWILDIGGGVGAWCRALLGKWPRARAVLMDLPETLAAGMKLYPDVSSWNGIESVAGNALTLCFGEQKFDMVVLSNILHAYGASEASGLLAGAVHSLAPGGLLLIHDYLADGHPSSPHKGRIYDLHMMLNTYNGCVYTLKELHAMLDAAGLRNSRLQHLETDTSILLSIKDASSGHRLATKAETIEALAGELGFRFAQVIEAQEIALAPWVRLKCEFGCSRYGVSLTCPPHSPDADQMKVILAEGYTHALLVQATPPSQQFHEQLLALERSLFLNGHPEALAFGAGPCPVCSFCPPDEICRFPEKARPALEACGVDVYETASRAGLALEPVRHREGYVRYIGMVLFKDTRNHAYSFHSGNIDAEL